MTDPRAAKSRPGLQTDAAKGRYHHGDLREALITAAMELVLERGAENFTLADACRRAGVSTAAPYKHFRDRDEVLEIVLQRGFDLMTEEADAAVAQAGPGTFAAMIALNKHYVLFAIKRPSLFKLMFGQSPELKQADLVLEQGQDCFGRVVKHFADYCEAAGIAEDPMQVCLRTWTFVHGLASLKIDEDYDAVAPDLDHMALLTDTLPLLLQDGMASGAR